MSTEVDKVFTGIPPSRKSDLNRDFKPEVLCSACRKKFAEFIKAGGEMPKACDACKEKMKNQMYEGRYPDRE